MKIETLKERIEKAEEKICKKQSTITKKTALIAKKTKAMEKVNGEEREWLKDEIDYLKEDLKRLESEIKETEKTIEKYRAQLEEETDNENLIMEVPEILKDLQAKLAEEWDRYDMMRRDFLEKEFKEMDYHEFYKKYRGQDTSIMDKTDEEIHKANEKAAESIILNLVNRVKDITGEITDWDLYLDKDNNGYPALNGIVTGKEGKAKVDSIGAGGYNVQRYHIRVLVKSI